MAITFALRGTSTTAVYGANGVTPGFYSSAGNITAVTSTAAGVIGGTLIDCNQTSGANKWLWYPGGSNLPTNQTISVLWSGSVDDTASFMGLFTLGGINGTTIGELNINSSNTSNLNVNQHDELDAAGINNVSSTPASIPLAAIQDILFTWTGGTAAASATLYFNGTALKTYTSTKPWSTSKTLALYPHIYFGAIGNPYIKYRLREFVIWDSVIDPTSVVLTNGTGALTGASRTAFVSVATFDGTQYTDPGTASVASGTSYTFAGTPKTGSLVTASTTSAGGTAGLGPRIGQMG